MDLYYFRGNKSCAVFWTFFVIVTFSVIWNTLFMKEGIYEFYNNETQIQLYVNRNI